MANPLRKLPAKAGRTAPSSRVKKIVKEGSRKFIGPRKFEGQLAEDQTARQFAEERPLRGKEARKRTQRKNSARFSREQAERELKASPLLGPPDAKVTAKTIYSKLRKNLSPDQQMMLDELTGRFKPLDIVEDYGDYSDFNGGVNRAKN